MAGKRRKQYDFTSAYLMFAVFGIMSAEKVGVEIDTTRIVIGVGLSLIAAYILIKLLVFSINSSNKELRQQKGPGFGKVMVSRGLFFMVPFVILAALAQYILGWNAPMSFASAAIMTAGASAGMEAVKEGAQGAKNVILPAILGTLVSTAWMLSINFFMP